MANETKQPPKPLDREAARREQVRAWLKGESAASHNVHLDRPERRLPGPVSFVLEVAKVVVVALICIFLIRQFLIKPFYVRGASMEPSFYDNEYLVIDEISYRFGEPARGDVIVFHYPENPSQIFIKRVIGLPGETVQVTETDIVITSAATPSGFTLVEPYLHGQPSYEPETFSLGQDEYFVMGDNRNSSLDSRRFGPVGRDEIIGKMWLRAWPVDRLDVFDRPDYGVAIDRSPFASLLFSPLGT